MNNFLKNISYVLGSQFMILFIYVIRSLILPAFLSVTSYGYWQIYLFYSTYVGVLALGFNDGIYLKYGNYDYDSLPMERLRSSVRIFTLMSILLTLAAINIILFFSTNPDLTFTLIYAALNIFILGLSGVFTYIFQITNQLKKFSIFSIADKLLVVLTVIFLFVIDYNNYKIIIMVDFGAKGLVLGAMIYWGKEILVGSNSSLSISLREFRDNISIGIKLLLANLMGMILIGIGRFLIHIWGNINDFASYSFGITITGLILTAINAFSLVLYPTIKRLDENNYRRFFMQINSSIISFNFLSLLVYFPSYIGVITYYSKYSDLLPYLNLLFVVTILQSKMSILNNTFYKVLREEKAMLTANSISVLIFVIIAPLVYLWTQSIWSIAFITVISMMFRSYASELYLRRLLNIKAQNDINTEILVTVLFIVITSFAPFYYGFASYILILAGWIFFKKNEIWQLLQSMKILR